METGYIIFSILFPTILAIVLCILWIRQRFTLQKKVQELDIIQQDIARLTAENEQGKQVLNQKEMELSSLQEALHTARQAAAVVQSQYDMTSQQIQELKTALSLKETECAQYQTRGITLEAQQKAMQEKLDAHQEEIKQTRNQLQAEFKIMANEIFDEKSQKFTLLNKENLDQILNPLHEKLTDFKKKVEEVYHDESQQRFALTKEIQSLVQLNQQISEDANNLTKALKGDAKKQGNWGEMILESILSQSGLQKDREYFLQTFLKDEEGNPAINDLGHKMQPDCIIKYPDKREVIIDSKVSLTAYVRYAETDDIDLQKEAIKDHLLSVKRHIDELSEKHYQDFAQSLDYVLMFFPNEPSFLLAIQNDSSLWEYAYQKRILLMSPTNLIAVLKIISDLWKREYQNQYAMAIADQGAKLYDKFVLFVENMDKIGGNISTLQTNYSNALKQLKDGNGNLITQAEKLRQLGVKTKKSLHKKKEIPEENE